MEHTSTIVPCSKWTCLQTHSINDVMQGVVTYMLPVEAFVTAIKFFDWQKVCLIA